MDHCVYSHQTAPLFLKNFQTENVLYGFNFFLTNAIFLYFNDTDVFLINWCFFLLMETEGSFMLNTWSPVLPLASPVLPFSLPPPAVLGAQQTTVSAAAGGSGESALIRCFPPEMFACSGLGSCLIQINWLVFWPGLVWLGPVHILSSLPITHQVLGLLLQQEVRVRAATTPAESHCRGNPPTLGFILKKQTCIWS